MLVHCRHFFAKRQSTDRNILWFLRNGPLVVDCAEKGIGTGIKVDKGQFGALLHKMMQAQPEPRRTIKPQGKAGEIVPSIQPPTLRKA
jgi:hypothetical protein